MRTLSALGASTLLLAVISLSAANAGCASVAVALAPEKKTVPDGSEEMRLAEWTFWNALHGDHYESIGDTLELYERAYLKNPNAPMTAARIGWLHTWRLAESARRKDTPATITDDVVLARKYFGEATKLAPSESRFLGFYASLTMAEGAIHKDEKLTRQGYFAMNDAIDAWPEFNLFTAGISVARLPHDAALFDEGVARQWENLDVCVDGTVDRSDGRFDQYMHLETKTGMNRACWDSWVAPHNLSGFFLHMGDMLVKKGDVAKARVMYENAKLPKSYASWKLRGVLDDRIAHAPDYVATFRDDASRGPNTSPLTARPFWSSEFACTGCHAN